MSNETHNTIVAYTYRYTWETKDGALCVKYITDIPSGLARFEEALQKDVNVKRAMCEYVSEVNYAFINFTREIKNVEKSKIYAILRVRKKRRTRKA